VAVFSICVVVVMCKALLGLVVLTQQGRQQGGTHDNNNTNRKYSHMPRYIRDEGNKAESSIATGTSPDDGQGY
jgi:hypothetical protein